MRTLSLQSLGHATVLIQIDNIRILTDPVLSPRIGMRLGPYTFGPRRLHSPVVPAKELPFIDLVLLSHAHFDHLDQPTLRQLSRETVAISAKGNRDLLRHFHDRRTLRWWEKSLLTQNGRDAIKVTAIPTKHWGARFLFDVWRGWSGFLIEFFDIPSPHSPQHPLSICFAGDTALTETFSYVRSALGGRGVDVVIMPIGAYDPWIFNHCSPEQAWKMGMQDLGAAYFLPIHFETFPLSREAPGEPLSRLRKVAQEDQKEHTLICTEIGETFTLQIPPSTHTQKDAHSPEKTRHHQT